MAEVELGINNAFAVKRFPEPMVWARIISKDLGLKQVQFSFDLLDPTLPEPARSALCAEVLEAVEKYGLTLRTTCTGLIAYTQNLLAHPQAAVRFQAQRWYEAAIEMTSKLSAEGTGGHIGAMSAADYDNPERRGFIRKTVVDSVRELSRRAAAFGQKQILWELMPTPREFPHTPEEAIDLMEEINEEVAVPIRLCFDLGHCSSFDLERPGNPHEWLEELLPWTSIVHLQQTDGKADRHWPFSPEYAKVGIIDPERVVEIVKDAPIDRVDLLFEIGHDFDASDQQIIDDHKWSVEAWSKAL